MTETIAEKTDEELAREARAGSRRSFDELARRYKRRLFVYLRPRLGSDEDAEDMVQETFLKLYRNIGGYDPAFKFSTWLYTSANRLAIDSFRRKSGGEGSAGRGEEIIDIPDPSAGAGEGSDASGLWEAARTLGGDRFRVLWLRYGEDLRSRRSPRSSARPGWPSASFSIGPGRAWPDGWGPTGGRCRRPAAAGPTARD